ncbi:MAG TPA: hypothetical protein VMU05_07000 [Dongiaceae bacterium]|nr:hypothetical protein [Dongiaceae bacterium]
MSTQLQTLGPTRGLKLSPHAQIASLLTLLVVIPLALSNHPAGAISGMLFLLIAFFFPGYLLLSGITGLSISHRLVLSPVAGILFLTTIYDVFARTSSTAYFFYLAAACSVAGIVLFVFRIRRQPPIWAQEDSRTVLAGSIVALIVAPLFWTSGRFSGDEFVFRGPAGQDPLFHVTLLQRLLHHVPPDNFMFSGVRPSVYHYFNDQGLALVVRGQQVFHLNRTDIFDLYYRCYPTLFYFVLGALTYVVGRQLLRTLKGGVLALLLLLGAGGLGWTIGLLQTAAHFRHFVELRERLLMPWTFWDGVDAIRPLVHRPAHSMGVLVTLAAISLLLVPARTRRHWIMTGLLLGLLAGFNFTLAATFGGAAVIGSILSMLQRRREDALNLAWLALFILIGSIPVNAGMIFSGLHNPAQGFPFRGPNLDLSNSIWARWLGRLLPGAVVPLASLVFLPIMAYGIKLLGIGALLRLDLGETRHRGLAMLLAITLAISFLVGTFFPYQGTEVGGIFLQPTFCILGLFALAPIAAWLERNRTNWRSTALWALLALIWIQALAGFNFASKATFQDHSARALQDVRAAAMPDDVVAYLPGDITERAIWGYSQQSTNFSIMAFTGLDGYFSNEGYSTLSALAGLTGSTKEEIQEKARHLYKQRLSDVESFVRGENTQAVTARLASDHVRWIVISGEATQEISPSVSPWRKTSDIAIYKLSP